MPHQITRSCTAMRELLSDASEYYPAFLELHFPHVLQRIVLLWGKPEIEGFLDGLLLAPKGNALGFPEQALSEIRGIRSLHLAVEPASIVASVAEEMAVLPVRETLNRFLHLDEETYPAMLEMKYPQLLQEILHHLGHPRMSHFLDDLLNPVQQLEYGFCERSMLDIMTLKAVHQLQYSSLSSAAENLGREHHDEDYSAQVFDRVQRW